MSFSLRWKPRKKNTLGSKVCKQHTQGQVTRPAPHFFMEVTPIAKKNPIISVKFSYVGKDSDFETFLKTIVRDYLAVDDPAANPEKDFVQKVESGAA